ncbi:hypothetical protein AHAS_Ahas02G0174700 [Arachis hypogaea]
MAIIADKSNLTVPYPSQPSPNVLEQNPVAQGISNLTARADSSGVFGPWMLAKKPQRRFNQSNGNVGTSIQTGNPIGSGSRFRSLEYVEQEESNIEAHVHKEGFPSNKHSVQAEKTKKLELPKHTSSSKSRLAGPKGTSKTQEGRSSREKEGGAKSTEESLVKGKEVVEGVSKVNLERKDTEYWRTLNLMKQMKYVAGDEELFLNGVPFTPIHQPSKEALAALKFLRGNAKEEALAAANPPDPGSTQILSLCLNQTDFLAVEDESVRMVVDTTPASCST